MKNKIFTHFLCLFFFVFLSTPSNAQTITAKPIYKGSQSLEIEEIEGGRIWFGYQNPDYSTIVDIVYFTTDSKIKALQLIDKAISILGMEKTDRDQHIRDSFEGVELVRYGFMQKSVLLSNGKDRGVVMTLKDCKKINAALLNYPYKFQKEK